MIATIAEWAGLATIEHDAPRIAAAAYLYTYGPAVPPLMPPDPPAPIVVASNTTARESYEHSDSTRIVRWLSPVSPRVATIKTTRRAVLSLHLATEDAPDKLINGQVLYRIDQPEDAAALAAAWINGATR